MKTTLVLFATALFVQATSGQCLRGPYNAGIYGAGLLADGFAYGTDIASPLAFDGLAYNGIGYGFGYNGLGCDGLAFDGLGYGAYGPYGGLGYGPANGLATPFSGGSFVVTSSSPIAPVGLTIASENVIEGILAVAGELPLVSAVALEGALPTIGSGAIAYGCGDGSIGIVSDIAPIGPITAPIVPFASTAYGFGGPFVGNARFGAPLAASYGAIVDGVGPAGCGCGAIY